MIRIVKLIRSSLSSPAQWEGLTDEKDVVYFRFRWGRLIVEKNKTTFFSEGGFGESLNGSLTFEELKKSLEGVIVFDCQEEKGSVWD